MHLYSQALQRNTTSHDLKQATHSHLSPLASKKHNQLSDPTFVTWLFFLIYI